MREVLPMLTMHGSKFHIPYRLARAAEAHLIAGQRLRSFSNALSSAEKGAFEQAAMSLARLLEARGRRSEAEGLLAPIYFQFDDGLEIVDLKHAKRWLELDKAI